MRKNSVTLSLILLISCFYLYADDIKLEMGKYESYYQEDKDFGFPTGINVILDNNMGQFSIIENAEEKGIEKYKWKIDEDILILNNYDNYLMNIETGETIETFDAYTQHFKIIKYEAHMLEIKLIKNTYQDGTEECFGDDIEPYIWKKITE